MRRIRTRKHHEEELGPPWASYADWALNMGLYFLVVAVTHATRDEARATAEFEAAVVQARAAARRDDKRVILHVTVEADGSVSLAGRRLGPDRPATLRMLKDELAQAKGDPCWRVTPHREAGWEAVADCLALLKEASGDVPVVFEALAVEEGVDP